MVADTLNTIKEETISNLRDHGSPEEVEYLISEYLRKDFEAMIGDVWTRLDIQIRISIGDLKYESYDIEKEIGKIIALHFGNDFLDKIYDSLEGMKGIASSSANIDIACCNLMLIPISDWYLYSDIKN